VAEEKINITIKGNSVSAKTALSTVDKSLKKTETATKKTSASFAKLKTAAKIAGAAILAGAVIMATKSVKAAAFQEEQQILLAQAMKTAGTFTKAAFQENLKYASSLQTMTKFGDEAILGVQRMLTNFGVEGEMLKTLTKSTLDLATAKGMDLKAAADLVAKSVGSSTNALTRYGIEVTGAAGSTERMQTAAENISKLFGGAAVASAKSFSGQLQQMKNSIGDLMEIIGTELIKAIIPVVREITKFVQSKEGIEAVKNTVRGVVTGFVVLFGVLRTVVNSIEIAVQSIVGFSLAVAAFVANFKKGMGAAKDAFADEWGQMVELNKKDTQDIADTWVGVSDLLKEIWTDTGTDFEELLNIQSAAQQQQDEAMRAGIIKNSAFARSMLARDAAIAKTIATSELKAIKKGEALKRKAIKATNAVKLQVMQAGLSAVIDSASDEMATAGKVAQAVITSMADALSNIMKMRALAALATGQFGAAAGFTLAAIAIKGIGQKVGQAIAGEAVKPIKLAEGGIIDEPVRGVGLRTGKSFLMGEAGTETATKITPEGRENEGAIFINELIIQAVDFEDVKSQFMNLHRLTNSQAVPR